MSSPRIFKSLEPSVFIPRESIFTTLFAKDPYSPEQPAFTDAKTGASINRAALKRLALSLAYGLRTVSVPNVLGVNVPLARGDTILIFSPNCLAYPVALFGAGASGFKVTLANSSYTSRELAFQYSDSKAKLVFTAPPFLKTVRAMFRELGVSEEETRKRIIVLTVNVDWLTGNDKESEEGFKTDGLTRMEDLLGLGSLQEEERFDGKLADETAYMCYSSGTSGKAKGVESTHENIVSLLYCVRPVFPPISTKDVMLAVLPFYHIFGAIKLLHFPVFTGTPVLIQRAFEPVEFCANIEKYRVTSAFVVPPMLVVLAKHPAVEKHDISSLQIVFSGAAPLGAALVRAVSAKMGGTQIMQGYGLTETSPTCHILRPEDSLRKIGSCGVLLPNLEARLVDDKPESETATTETTSMVSRLQSIVGLGGRDEHEEGVFDVDEGQPGELWIRGPTVMKGYLNNPEATKAAITSAGWFRTGDVAVRDSDGFYYIVDRRKELIKYKGFQVPPAELESVLLEHPDIADTAVIGVESVEEATELPRAYIVHARPTEVNTPELQAKFGQSVQKWIETKVAAHKRLRGGVILIDMIPKSAAGKILRRELRDRAKTEPVVGREVRAKL